MTAERWARIKEIFSAASIRPQQERTAFLDSVCDADALLRAQVERLLAQDDESLKSPAAALLAPAVELSVGEQLSHYRVEAKVGAGGMGAVYRAYDTRLHRHVALKVLAPEHFADPKSKHRLMREARAASALNHPNIVAVHEIGADRGVDFIAMEFVEGKTLHELVPAGGLVLGKALDYGAQIASALAKAHGSGVVHGDLKPGNIMVTPDGLVKLLDFGLARRVQLKQDETTVSMEGDIAGTPAYMSPEQAEGKSTDTRSDVFAFGAVLYEMLTGRQAFSGDSVASVLAAVLREEPLPLEGKIPDELEKVVTRCLQKNPTHRFQHMADVRVALEELKGESDSGKVMGASRWWWPGRSVRLGLAVLALVAVVLVSLTMLSWRGRLPDRIGTPQIASLAVLPMKNFSGDPDQEFFADGMTDALIAGLSQIKAVSVISRTSVMHYKGTSKTMPQIAREMGVDGVVEASVMRSGGRVRVTAQLIDARHDRHLWASNFEREMTDVLALQSALVQAIADEIRVQLTAQESERLKTVRQVDPEVYDATTKGRAILEYATREEQFHQAIELFQRAVDHDPNYASAWAGLGQALWSLAGSGFEFVAPEDVREKAIAAADRALQLDASLAEAHKARADIALEGEWDLAKAQQEYERALELRPSYADAHYAYSFMLCSPLPRFDESRRHYDRARELDPLSPFNDIGLVGWWLNQGKPEKALAEGERANQRNPMLWGIPWLMGIARLRIGQPLQAVPEFQGALKLLSPNRPTTVLAPLGLAYGLAGRRADALEILAEMEGASKKRYVSPYHLAAVYSGLGRTDEAFSLLYQALERRNPWLTYSTPHDPLSIALRRDQRWKPFVERLRRLVRLPLGTPNPYL
jgi:eukaryotic-like serine/threonine-protein kinase